MKAKSIVESRPRLQQMKQPSNTIFFDAEYSLGKVDALEAEERSKMKTYFKR